MCLLMQQKQQYAKKERLQRFNQHVEELRANLKQDLAKKVCHISREERPGGELLG